MVQYITLLRMSQGSGGFRNIRGDAGLGDVLRPGDIRTVPSPEGEGMLSAVHDRGLILKAGNGG